MGFWSSRSPRSLVFQGGLDLLIGFKSLGGGRRTRLMMANAYPPFKSECESNDKERGWLHKQVSRGSLGGWFG